MKRSPCERLAASVAAFVVIWSAGAQAADFGTWSQRMKITFAGYNKPETLTNFPVLVVFTDGLGGGFKYIDFLSLTNQDLRFSDSNGTVELNYEIASWNTNGNACVWVQVPTLASSNDYVYAYWGKASVTAPAYTTNGAAWSDGYVGVYHLEETSGTVVHDSSTNHFNGTLVSGTWSNGFTGNGLLLNGSSDYFTLPSISSRFGNNAGSFLVWVKLANATPVATGRTGFMNLGTGSNCHYPWTDGTSYQNIWRGGTRVDSIALLASVTRTAWHQVSVTSETGGTGLWKMHQNGIEIKSTAAQAMAVPATPEIGRFTGTYYLDGMIDEVQIANRVFSSNRVSAAWLNLASNSVFNSYTNVPANKPVVYSGAASKVTATSASLNGSLSSTGMALTTVAVYWDTNDWGNALSGWVSSLSAASFTFPGNQNPGPLSADVTGLTGNNVYYFRYYATNSFGDGWSAPVPFITGALTVQATTSTAQAHGGSPGVFTIFRPATCTGLALTVSYALSGTASNGVDYTWLNGSALFSAAATSTAVTVAPLTNPQATNNPTVMLTLLPANYAIGAPSNDTVTIAETLWYVTTNGLDSNLGTSWAQAFATISNAAAHANAGELVQVSNGIYTVTTQIAITNGLVVRGVNGAANTSVNGNYPLTTNRVFFLSDANAVVDGFTITNGYVAGSNVWGGGVYMSAGWLVNCTVSGCTSTNPSSDGRAGGVYLGSGTVTNCLITKNTANNYRTGYGQPCLGGGGIYVATGLVYACQIISNHAEKGGGVGISGGIVSNCLIKLNVGDLGPQVQEQFGGGVFGSGGLVVSSQIISNSVGGANQCGGGAYGGSYVNCIFLGNFGAVNGGGVFGPALLQNCLVTRNTASTFGGGVYCSVYWGAPFQNCTVCDNSAGNSGGGVYLASYNGAQILENSIIWNNTAAGSPNWAVNGAPFTEILTNSFSDTLPLLGGPGAVNADPLFVDESHNNYQLQLGSPCIDAGTNDASYVTNTLDMAGNPRVANGTVDMGAYEYTPLSGLACSIVGNAPKGLAPLQEVFTATASGGNTNGLYYQWDFTADGFVDAQGADKRVVTNTYSTLGYYTVALTVTNAIGQVAVATNVNYVYVAPATTYVSTVGGNLAPYTNWSTALTGIQAAVNAGFDGTLVLVSNGTYFVTSQIVITNGITVQSVNGTSNTVVTRTGTNQVRIFYLSHPNAVLQGLTITNGLNNGTSDRGGGGVFIQKRVDIPGTYGGTLSNCIIKLNTTYPQSNEGGGGVRVVGGGLIEYCTIDSNVSGSANGGGGGVAGAATVLNCAIRWNRTTQQSGYPGWGGGLFRVSTLQNCLIVGNEVTNGGGYGGAGYQCASLYNCTVSDNKGDACGGLYASTVISNSIVYFNTQNIIQTNAATATNIVGGTVGFTCSPDVTAGTNGNITADPLFKNRVLGDYRLAGGSPCVDAGSNMAWMTATPTNDFGGGARILGKSVDMGAYESAPASRGAIITVR